MGVVRELACTSCNRETSMESAISRTFGGRQLHFCCPLCMSWFSSRQRCDVSLLKETMMLMEK